jgi:hypothetical protein
LDTAALIGDDRDRVSFIGGPAITVNTGDGIFLDTSESNSKDKVFLINASGTGNDSTTFDLHDGSSTCGSNQWVHNEYGTSEAGGVMNPACIPDVPIP